MNTQPIHKLHRWRFEHRLSQNQAGDLIGVTGAAWGRYEAGRVPDSEILQKIIDLTNGEVTANDFFDLPEPKSGQSSQEAAA